MKSSLLLVILLVLLAAPAQAQGLVSVTDVEVDKTAENAVVAREQAITEGRRAAFMRLAERYLPAERLQTYQLPADAVINRMVQDFEITREQIGGDRYLATFAYRFKPDALSLYFGVPVEGEMPAPQPQERQEESAQKQVLVLPFVERAGRPVLWADPNPWLQAWQAARLDDLAQTYRLPLGDVTDMAAGPTADVWSGDMEAVEKLQAHYAADDILLTIAAPAGGNLKVDVYGLREGSPVLLKSMLVHGVASYARAVGEVIAWREGKAVAAAPAAAPAFEAEVRAAFSRPAEWIEIQRRLRAVAPAPSVEIVALSRSDVRFVLRYAGGENDLREALAAQRVVLEQGATGYTIRLEAR